jgi:hypothetical protein
LFDVVDLNIIDTVSYKVILNGNIIVPLYEEWSTPLSTPYGVNIEINDDLFSEDENSLEIYVRDSIGQITMWEYTVIREDVYTLQMMRKIEFGNQYETVGDIQVDFSEGLILRDAGSGYISSKNSLNTTGKATILQIKVNSSDDNVNIINQLDEMETTHTDNGTIHSKDIDPNAVSIDIE